ncbi:hypothetical protein D3C76_162920 [compost metagenome]
MGASYERMLPFVTIDASRYSALHYLYVGIIIDPDQIAKRVNPEDPRSADLSAGREVVKTRFYSVNMVLFKI